VPFPVDTIAGDEVNTPPSDFQVDQPVPAVNDR
jgi:hypothetical protein